MVLQLLIDEELSWMDESVVGESDVSPEPELNQRSNTRL